MFFKIHITVKFSTTYVYPKVLKTYCISKKNASSEMNSNDIEQLKYCKNYQIIMIYTISNILYILTWYHIRYHIHIWYHITYIKFGGIWMYSPFLFYNTKSSAIFSSSLNYIKLFLFKKLLKNRCFHFCFKL